MIKFFRKIRQNMIKEKKASKYLLYAIGEIIIVVIIQKYNLNLKTFTNRSPLGRG
jgi:predicted regulator of Ras-like GTPase activity (Roadblock/LC7/MglB family)